ncbi:Tn3 family transposase [uncultured Nostoc sp.]|uniref:Tn3 family transposase n=1 Tax=uncultured Nostoc sp. TaxID=340711 RepID=UPI0035CC0E9C
MPELDRSEEQQKIIKYHDLIPNAVIFHNVVDLTNILRDLKREGYFIMREDVAFKSLHE